MYSKWNKVFNFISQTGTGTIGLLLILMLCCWGQAFGQNQMLASENHLEGTQLLTKGAKDLRLQMLHGIEQYFKHQLANAYKEQQKHWHRNYSSHKKYLQSIKSNRAQFKKITGVVEQRKHVKALTLIKTTTQKAIVAQTDAYTIYSVRWPVFDDVSGVGLWIEPHGNIRAQVVAIPDAEHTPEMLAGLSPGVPPAAQFARRLAAAGCRVVIPVLINRKDTWTKYPGIRVVTNETHREFFYRRAYEMGRHIIGYEIQKVMGVVDWFTRQNQEDSTSLPIAVAGYGEGGLIALYSGAVDQRIDGVLVSGYFQERKGIWKEPIYRNVWGLLTEFGDAEIASLIASRHLTVEASKGPTVDGPPPADSNHIDAAASGRLKTPPLASVKSEYRRAKKVFRKLDVPQNLQLVVSGKQGRGLPGSTAALDQLLRGIGVQTNVPILQKKYLRDRRVDFSPSRRQRRQFTQLLWHLNKIINDSREQRKKFFWDRIDTSSTMQNYIQSLKPYRKYFWNQIIGKMPPSSKPFNPRTRLAFKTNKFRAYWVELDVLPHIIAAGILLIPNDVHAGEKRPLVVCRHGLGATPGVVTKPNVSSIYHSFGAKLANRGYVVYAPQSLYGLMPQQSYANYSFRIIDRMAEPLGKTIYSVMVDQMRQTLDWLKQLPFVNGKHIGVYGLSYGAKSAIRLAPILQDYSAVILVGDFNHWVWKTTSILSPKSYLYTPEFDMYGFDFANTTSYASMAAMLAPSALMIVRGHRDVVSTDAQVAYEYAKVRKLYDRLGIGDRTCIKFFNGPHEIHEVFAYPFLNKYLKTPKTK